MYLPQLFTLAETNLCAHNDEKLILTSGPSTSQNTSGLQHGKS